MKIDDVLKYFLPVEIIEHFELVNIRESHDEAKIEMHIFLDEKFVYPGDYSADTLESKGFQNTVYINDFPIQNKKVKLCLRKRRWVDKVTKKAIVNQYDLKHKGTNYSNGLAHFLKDGVG